MEEVPTVRAAGVSSEAPKRELGESGLLALSMNQDQAQSKLYLLYTQFHTQVSTQGLHLSRTGYKFGTSSNDIKSCT